MVFAAPSTDAISAFGILCSYNDFKLEGGSQSDKDHLPQAGLYYTRNEYKLDQDSDVADNTKLKRDEYGLKVGIAF